MKTLFCSLLLLAGVWAKEQAILETKQGVKISDANDQLAPGARSFTVELGASHGSLHTLNDRPPLDENIVIFLGSTATRDGKVCAWEFSTVEPGKFCLGVFNHKKSLDGRHNFVEFGGENCFEVFETRATTMVFEIPREHRIAVRSNSMAAVQYHAHSAPRVITMETGFYPPSRHLQRYPIMFLSEKNLVEPQGQDFLLPGTIVEEYPVYDYRMNAVPSFKMVVCGATNLLNLQYGPNKQSGLGMVYLRNQWGTMCDKWFHSKGWPQLFCDEKDFPGTISVSYNNGQAVNLPDSVPILMHNPHCKESQNSTMLQCVTREDQPCTHNEDLFIKCRSKVELRGPYDKRNEGVCMVYESNYWGSICDTNGPHTNPKADPKHWSHACCREAGYKNGAIKLDWASNNIYSPLGRHPVSLHSPVCEPRLGEELDDIDECQDGPVNESCTSQQDIYVICDPSYFVPYP